MKSVSKRLRISRSGDHPPEPAATQEQVDALLEEIARLYREQFRAHFNGDQNTLKTINEQIALLKSKLNLL